jgi:Copine
MLLLLTLLQLLTTTATTEQQGVKGILDAYQSAINRITLSGPTLFAEIIKAAASAAAVATAKQAYTVLLILTDGIINDMDATKNAVVAVNGLPLSIIIVGVGHADFSAMQVREQHDTAVFAHRAL